MGKILCLHWWYNHKIRKCGYYIRCNSCRKDIKLNHQHYPQHFIEHVKQVHIKETETKANSNIRQFFSKKSRSEGIKSVSSLSKFSSHNLFPCGGIFELSLHESRIKLYEEYAKIDEKASYAMIRRQYGRPDGEWQVYARDCEKTKASVIKANTRRCSSCCDFVLCALGLSCLAVWCDRLFLSLLLPFVLLLSRDIMSVVSFLSHDKVRKLPPYYNVYKLFYP